MGIYVCICSNRARSDKGGGLMDNKLFESLAEVWAKTLDIVKEYGEEITSVEIYTPHGHISLEWTSQGWRLTEEE